MGCASPAVCHFSPLLTDSAMSSHHLSDSGEYKCGNVLTVHLAVVSQPICTPEVPILTLGHVATFYCQVINPQFLFNFSSFSSR